MPLPRITANSTPITRPGINTNHNRKSGHDDAHELLALPYLLHDDHNASPQSSPNRTMLLHSTRAAAHKCEPCSRRLSSHACTSTRT